MPDIGQAQGPGQGGRNRFIERESLVAVSRMVKEGDEDSRPWRIRKRAAEAAALKPDEDKASGGT